MRILQLISSLDVMSGAVRSLTLLSKGLAQRGHDIVVVSYSGEKMEVADQLRQMNIPVFVLNADMRQGLLNYQMTSKLRKIINQFDIDVIHAHSWDADWFASLPFLKKSLKRVVTVHSLSYFQWAQSHPLKYSRWILPRVDRFVLVCDYLANHFKEKYAKFLSKQLVIHNCPEEVFFTECDTNKRLQFRDAWGVKPDEKVVGFVGHFGWAKGLNFFLETIALMQSDATKVVMVGSNYESKRKEIDDFLKENNLTNKVIFTGFQSDIPGILDAMDVYVHPSLEEADPWVVSEALAKGKPVVATNVGGVAEKVKDGVNGRLVPSEDKNALAQVMTQVIDNEEQQAELSRNARNFMKEHFSFNQMIDQYENVFQSLKEES